MKSHKTRVKSYFRGKDTRFFEEDLSKISHPEQMRRFRDTFAISNGEHGTVDLEAIGSVRIDYEGQLTIVSSLEDNQFFFNHCSGPDVSIIKYPSALNDFRSTLSPKDTVSNAAFCLSMSGYNFHCFLFEILPSLIALKEELRETENLILGATAGGSFIEEFNEILKFHQSIHLLPLRSSIKVTNAVAVTSFPFRIYPVDILEEICLRMRKASEEFSSVKGGEICFIGRADRDRNRRNLLNEDAVLRAIVERFGEVKIVRPGITALIETVTQVRDARVIVGMLGGSLAHLMWAHSLRLFIEIVPYTYFGTTETEELSRIYGFEYHRVKSTNVDSDNWAWADQNCEMNDLVYVLKKLTLRDTE